MAEGKKYKIASQMICRKQVGKEVPDEINCPI
jgi:hypothetical protein